MQETHLVVVSPFGDYAVGDVISDAAKVEELRGRRDVVVPVDGAALRAMQSTGASEPAVSTAKRKEG